MSTNITKVFLCQVPLENDYKHTFYFSSSSQQQTYFVGRRKHTLSEFSYQRKDSTMRIPLAYDEAIQCNYVMYQNTAYSDKWFYAFITDYEYKGEDQTNIKIETDVIQTWMFDYRIQPSFIEREHTSDDSIGSNLVDETLQLGEYVCNRYNKAGYSKDGFDMTIVVGVTESSDGEKFQGGLYKNVVSGIKYYTFYNDNRNESQGIPALQRFLKAYDDEGKAEAIQCMFLAPAKLIYASGGEIPTSDTPSLWFINNPDKTSNTNLSLSTGKIDGYTPNNNKLLTYPFRYLMVSNNAGTDVPMRYEFFYEFDKYDEKVASEPSFRIDGCVTPGCSVRMIPRNYKGVAENHSEGVNLGKYPALNWNSDVYTNWLTQNGVNIGISIASDVVQTGLGIAMALAGGAGAVATGGVSAIAGLAGASTAVSGVSSISSTIGEIYKASLTPPQSKGNTNNGDIITATYNNDFHFYDMTINHETAQIIDEYFDMFGYKTNRVSVPNVNHRKCWWYTKTIDVNITYEDGHYIPISDLEKIKSCYNNGITFWKEHASNFKNYGMVNSII